LVNSHFFYFRFKFSTLFAAAGALVSRSMREFFVLTLLIVQSALAAEAPPRANATNVSSEVQTAMRKMKVVPGFHIEPFATEPMIQNPVSFTFDEKGRAYVVETYRRRTSVYDIRNHPDWVDDDFSFRTVADRSNFFRKVLVPGNTNLPSKIIVDRNHDGKFDWHDLEVESERIRLLTDTSGDGHADKVTTFADNFKTLVSGVAAGVLAHKGDIYFTCIPNLWLLRDFNGDGVSDYRKSLADGFGVHISYGGHDLHGLKFGPDGKLYFSIADRGLNVVSGGHTISNPDSGAVLRCNPDGSDLELFATGLRNPQELAFDQFGNLWTGDNNGDGGDKARWLYVVEGGEYGWRMGWQHQPKLGAWNSEALWEMQPKNTAAYLLPPVAHIGHGPAGLSFYPGTGLPPEYNNHFFLCDFPGGVHTFSVFGKGAGFEVTDLKQFLWELYPVDVDFGSLGGVFVLDWVEGWDKPGKGRLYHLFEDTYSNDIAMMQTRKLLSEDFDKKSMEELANLLSHQDMRIRQAAQFALAAKGLEATNTLSNIALNSTHELARIHAIWGIGQIARTSPLVYPLLFPLLADTSDSEIRAQAAKVLGDGKFQLAFPYLARAALDPIPRVRYFGLIGLGKLASSDALETVRQVLRDNNDADPYLRHAAVMALTWMNDANALESLAHDSSPAVRMGALLAMRRLHRPEVAMFLYESRPQLVLEAARAIYDVPLEESMSQLAALINSPAAPQAAVRRALHANYRLGKLENAMALSDFAGKTNIVPELRALAVELLGRWGEPAKRDLFTGLWHPLPARESRAAALTLRSEVPVLLRRSSPPEVRSAAVQATIKLQLDSAGPELSRIVQDQKAPPKLRVASLRALVLLKDPSLAEALTSALKDGDPALRKEASGIHLRSEAGDPTAAVLKTIESGSIEEKQSAFEMLGTMPASPAVDPVLVMWLDRVVSGKAPRELELEILEAASKRKDPLIKSQLESYEKKRASNPMLKYSECLAGGDADAGKKIFFERADLGCVRCHKLKGTGGEVGPDLTGIGSRANREYLLESIILPNKRISKGFENLVIKMKTGPTYIGMLKKEDQENVYINSPEDGALKIPKASIASLDLGLSAMPAEMVNLLSKRDLRNLIAFLAAQK
jgi:quinoprotein glucose dehydrogenase